MADVPVTPASPEFSPTTSPTTLLRPEDKEDYLSKDTSSSRKLTQSLRFKTFLVLSILFFLLTVAFLAVILGVFPSSFIQVEASEARDALARPLRAAYQQFDSLSKTTLNQVIYDQSYYVTTGETYVDFDGNKKTVTVDQYIAENFAFPSMLSANIFFAAFAYLNGTIFLSVGYNLTDPNGGNIPLPTEMTNIPAATIQKILSSSAYALIGYGYSFGRLVLIAAGPILRSDFSGPPVGVGLLGMVQDDYMVQVYADKAQVCVNFGILDAEIGSAYLKNTFGYMQYKVQHTITNASTANWIIDYSNVPVNPMDRNYLQGRTCWAGLTPKQVSPSTQVNGDRMQTLTIIEDWDGRPQILLMVDVDRNTFQLGMTAMGIALGVLMGTLLVVALIILIFVEFAVLNPVVKLTNSINDITTSGNVTERVGTGKESRDELGTMCECMNLMLESLDSAQLQIKNVLERTGLQEQRARAIMNAIPDFVLCILEDGLINHANDAFLSRFNLDKRKVDDVINITSILSGMTLDDLKGLCRTGNYKDAQITNPNSLVDIVPVSVACSPITIFLNDEPVKAYVAIAKNNSDKVLLQAQIKDEQDRSREHKRRAEFNKVMNSKQRRSTFRAYCARTNNQRNVDFLEAVEEYKTIKNIDARCDKQQEIIDQYLVEDAPNKIKINQSVLDAELPLITKGYAQLDLFDVVAEDTKNNMITGSFFKFMQLPPVEREDDESSEQWF